MNLLQSRLSKDQVKHRLSKRLQEEECAVRVTEALGHQGRVWITDTPTSSAVPGPRAPLRPLLCRDTTEHRTRVCSRPERGQQLLRVRWARLESSAAQLGHSYTLHPYWESRVRLVCWEVLPESNQQCIKAHQLPQTRDNLSTFIGKN